MKNQYAIIMAGGIGSRFWPMSSDQLPKQFLDILGTGETLIQQTFRRLSKICGKENILVVTNKKYKDLCLEQLQDMEEENLLLEPIMRNTAPCIAYACYKIFSQNRQANIIVAPSDHLITNEDEFVNVVQTGMQTAAKHNILITIGIHPNRPDTGYGYIQFQEQSLAGQEKIKKVKTFTEKPDQELALQFLNSGDFLWNSGIFIWSVTTILQAFQQYLPDLHDLFQEGEKLWNTPSETTYIDGIFPACKNISIDYGILEKAENVYVIPADFGWSDLGTWGSLYEQLAKDENQNAVHGDKILLYNCSNNIVNLPNHKTVVLQGLSGYIVVEKEGTLLVCRKDDEQQIRQFVADVKKLKE